MIQFEIPAFLHRTCGFLVKHKYTCRSTLVTQAHMLSCDWWQIKEKMWINEWNVTDAEHKGSQRGLISIKIMWTHAVASTRSQLTQLYTFGRFWRDVSDSTIIKTANEGISFPKIPKNLQSFRDLGEFVISSSKVVLVGCAGKTPF